jgi:hypothetical protein
MALNIKVAIFLFETPLIVMGIKIKIYAMEFIPPVRLKIVIQSSKQDQNPFDGQKIN